MDDKKRELEDDEYRKALEKGLHGKINRSKDDVDNEEYRRALETGLGRRPRFDLKNRGR
jgi:hypothetical protein